MISRIKKALVTAYQAGGVDGPFFTSAQTSFPNVKFTKPSVGPWARISFMPNSAVPFGLGPEGTDYCDGIFQIDLNYPPDSGDGAATGKADSLCALFRAGSRFSFEGQETIIKSCGHNGGFVVDDVFRVVVSIAFYSVYPRP